MNEKKRTKAIAKALESIPAVGLNAEEARQYFEMIYDIGYFNGSKQSSHQKQVEQLKDGVVVKTYPSVTYAAMVLGVHKSTISKNVNDGNKSRSGSTFRYKLVN